MKIKSLVSIVAKAESAKDRRLAIRGSWSIAEAADRRQIAIESQLFLDALIAQGRHRATHIDHLLDLVAC